MELMHAYAGFVHFDTSGNILGYIQKLSTLPKSTEMKIIIFLNNMAHLMISPKYKRVVGKCQLGHPVLRNELCK